MSSTPTIHQRDNKFYYTDKDGVEWKLLVCEKRSRSLEIFRGSGAVWRSDEYQILGETASYDVDLEQEETFSLEEIKDLMEDMYLDEDIEIKT